MQAEDAVEAPSAEGTLEGAAPGTAAIDGGGETMGQAEEQGGQEQRGEQAEDGADVDEADADALDVAALEEEAARKCAAAVEQISDIPVGQAFCTMRVMKKAGETLRATPPTSGPSTDPAPANPDLSFMLPGPAFTLPTPKFGEPPTPADHAGEEQPSASASASAPAQPQASPSSASNQTTQQQPAPAPAEDGPAAAHTGDSLNDLDASLHAKLLATWHYAEATEDGGIAISFGDLEGVDLDGDCEELYATMLKHVEQGNEDADNDEADFMNQMSSVPDGDEAGQEQDGMGLPGPAFDLPSPAFAQPGEDPPTPTAVLPPVREEASEHDVSGDPEPSQPSGGGGGGALALPPVPAGSGGSITLAAKPSPRLSPGAEPAAAAALPRQPSVEPAAPPFARPSSERQPVPPLGAGLLPLSSLNQTTPRSGAGLSRETVKTMKADLARTIRSELQKSMMPARSNASGKGQSSTAAAATAALAALNAQDPRGAEPPRQSGDRVRASPGGTPLSANSTAHHQSTLDKSIRVGFVEGKIRPINIVMLIVGTRGDVQPFIGIGLKLKEYGHRVRIASHKVYREFVTGFGLEFYPIGGDPKVLSEFVVKHRGIMPGFDIADALQQREQVKEILYSSWGACVLPDPENLGKPFIADAIVANPPAYGHTHCAEKLNVPLHIVFTMPWTPTKHFPNPFARIKTVIGGTNSKAREVMNWLSYFAVEDLAWLGMSGMVKDFRKNTLQLTDWASKDNGSHAIYHSKVPMTYIWSPSLVDRPADWPNYCECVGFINVELQKLTKYHPPKELQDFLDAGPPPVYIGFGSLVVDDPEKLTRCFLEALKATGLRAIIQKGWGGLGAGVKGAVDDVLFIGPAPHDWLFTKCCAVVHHGGAGTTACGLYCGKPTFIVPFFGDQPFWGAACHRAGVGPPPVAIDDLNTPRIIDALKTLVMPNSQRSAKTMQERMAKENGIDGTVDHLHRTIYGALLAGKTFKWMKHGASRNLMATSNIEDSLEASSEDSAGPNGLKGFFRSFFVKSTVSSSTKSTASKSPLGPCPPPLTPVDSANRVSNAGFSFHVNATAASREAPTPSPGSALQPRATKAEPGAGAGAPGMPHTSSAAALAAPAVEIADMPRRKSGFFSFLGC